MNEAMCFIFKSNVLSQNKAKRMENVHCPNLQTNVEQTIVDNKIVDFSQVKIKYYFSLSSSEVDQKYKVAYN